MIVPPPISQSYIPVLTSILHICAPEDLINSAVSDITTLQSLVKFAEELKIKASGENKDIERQEEEEEEAALKRNMMNRERHGKN